MPSQPNASPNPQANELSIAFGQLRGAFLTVAIFSGFLNLLMLAPSLYMLQVYDRVLASRNETTLWVLTLLLLGIYVFMGLLESIRTWVLVRVGARFDSQLGTRVFNASFERNLRTPGGNAAQPVHDLNTLRQTLTGSALLALFDAPWLPIYILVIGLLSVELAVFALVGAMLLAGLAVLNEKITKPKLDEAQQVNNQAQLTMANHLRNAEVIESMGMLPAVRQRWQELHTRLIGLQASASDQAAVMGGLTKFLRISMQSLSLGFGALLVLEGRMSPGGMIAASVLVSRALAPVEQLVGNWKQIITGRAAWARLLELLQTQPARVPGMALPRPVGAVKFENVSVAAPGSQQLILRGLSFTIAAGECIAVIGPSGSGKSTLARVLMGVWGAQAGVARLDGADLRQWSRDDLGPHMGYLPQDVELFDGTVSDNIARFGEVEPERVIEAAKRAGMHETILRLAKGYDTPLAAGGGALSGGQRQRIGIARALYGNPALVVLDEPNSNLDDAGEKALADTVRDLAGRGVTTVLVTHRPSSLASVQKIMLLLEGSIKAFGPRDDVLASLQPKTATAGPSPVAVRQPGGTHG